LIDALNQDIHRAETIVRKAFTSLILFVDHGAARYLDA
jgi:hypothetical protein